MWRVLRLLGLRRPPAVRHQVAWPRIELGFRDGSVQRLAPGSVAAKSLQEIAAALTRRD